MFKIIMKRSEHCFESIGNSSYFGEVCKIGWPALINNLSKVHKST